MRALLSLIFGGLAVPWALTAVQVGTYLYALRGKFCGSIISAWTLFSLFCLLSAAELSVQACVFFATSLIQLIKLVAIKKKKF